MAPSLTGVSVALGWDTRTTTGADFDLDASALLYGANGTVIDDSHFVFFKKWPEGSVDHTGDNLTGEGLGDGDDDDEVTNVDLSRVPTTVDKVVSPVSIYEAEPASSRSTGSSTRSSLIGGVTAHLNPLEAQARLGRWPDRRAGTYAYLLHEAHPGIAAFCGMCLFMLFRDFIFDDRDIAQRTWLELERPLARIGKLDLLSVVVVLGALVVAVEVLAEHPGTVMIAGTLGAVTYLQVTARESCSEPRAVRTRRLRSCHASAGTPTRSPRSSTCRPHRPAWSASRARLRSPVLVPEGPRRVLRRGHRCVRYHGGLLHHRGRPRASAPCTSGR